jgi:hypothetical protein
MMDIVVQCRVKEMLWKSVYLLPKPTACLADSRRDSELPEELPVTASPAFWLSDFAFYVGVSTSRQVKASD